MATAHGGQIDPPEPGWEGAAARWVGHLALVVATAVGGVWCAASMAPTILATGGPQTRPTDAPPFQVPPQEQNKPREESGAEEVVESCADCSCEALDCAGGDCSDCGSCGDCGGVDCGSCDCGGVDCGGCAVAKQKGGACRRGRGWVNVLALAAPLALFAAWRRLPQRPRRKAEEAERDEDA